jgi:hypothetical protein
MAGLSKEEKAKVRADVRKFAEAPEAERYAALAPPVKKSFREKVKAAFEKVLGA